MCETHEKTPKKYQDCKGPTDGRIFIKKETYQMTTYRIDYSMYGNIKDLNPGTLKPKNKSVYNWISSDSCVSFWLQQKVIPHELCPWKISLQQLKIGKISFLYLSRGEFTLLAVKQKCPSVPKLKLYLDTPAILGLFLLCDILIMLQYCQFVNLL